MVKKKNTKDYIRKKYLKIRTTKSPEQLNFTNIFSLIRKNFSNKKIIIAAYYPYNYEVNVLPFVKLANMKNYKTVLPVVYKKNNMKFEIWNYNEPLTINRFGILEPQKSNKNIYPDCFLVPLAVYDDNFNRIGYGKGFYDRALNKISKIKKKIITIGIAYSFQRVNKIPVNKHDYKLDYILNENGIICRDEI